MSVRSYKARHFGSAASEKLGRVHFKSMVRSFGTFWARAKPLSVSLWQQWLQRKTILLPVWYVSFICHCKTKPFDWCLPFSSSPLFTTCANPIMHLIYPLSPPKKKICIGIVFDLGHFHVPGEIANNGYAKVLAGNRGVLWYCASSELENIFPKLAPFYLNERNKVVMDAPNYGLLLVLDSTRSIRIFKYFFT